MKITKIAALALAAGFMTGTAATPGHAALVLDAACDTSLPSPDAVACSGYWEGNLLGGSPAKVQDQIDAIAQLPGSFVFDGNWAPVDATKVTSLVGGNQIDFGQTLTGLTVIGAHFGNVAGPAGNSTVFWEFDFGAVGVSSVTLDNAMGFSNAVLYTTGAGAVPEPGTWLMMILGFGAIGASLRARKSDDGKRVTFA